MKQKLKKIRSVASLLPFVIILCAIEMGGCDSGSEITCEQAKQQLEAAKARLQSADKELADAKAE